MDRDVVLRAVAAGGLSLPDDLEFSVEGDEPILPSPHHLATGAAVARLLTGVGANALWCARGGRAQRLEVDARHAAASLLSFLFTQIVDPARRLGPDARDDAGRQLTQIFATADNRHIQLHGSFHDADAVLAELGVSDGEDLDAVVAAVRSRHSLELEAALIDRGLCGGVVLSRSEWAAHPQGRALRGQPVVRVTRIADAPPEPLAPAGQPASGLRVLDLTRVLAGPTCAKTFAEHGADVLHVTNPRSRTIPLFDVDTGIGKRQCALDLDQPDDVAALRALVAGADVVSQGYRLGALSRRALGPLDVAALRPGVVYVSENCYGPTGPWAARPGWEQLAQAATGMSHREGVASVDGVPRLAPAAANDYATGWLAAYGAMIALARRATEGGSWLVECSLSQTASWYQDLGDDLDPFAADSGDPSRYLHTMDTDDFGELTFLRPALAMSETPPRFARGPSRDGRHEPTWLARDATTDSWA